MYRGIKKDLYCICEEWFCIRDSICNTVIRLPWMCFKMSFKIAVVCYSKSIHDPCCYKKDIWTITQQLLLGRSSALSPLSRRNQSVSPWRNTSWHLNWLCHLALRGDWLCFPSFLSFNLQMNSLCLQEISVQKKQTNDGFAQLGQARFCLFIPNWLFYTDWDETWPRCWISQRKGKKNKVHGMSINCGDGDLNGLSVVGKFWVEDTQDTEQ